METKQHVLHGILLPSICVVLVAVLAPPNPSATGWERFSSQVCQRMTNLGYQRTQRQSFR